MRQVINETGRLAVYADAYMDGGVIDIHKQMKSKNIEVATNNTLVMNKNTHSTMNNMEMKLDFLNWLPFAAKKYHLSGDISDYFFVPVLTIPSDLPNRNGVAFPLATLLEFNPERGCQGYKTFKGQPVQYEHDNKDITKARGIIVDTHLSNLKGYCNNKLWKVLLLLAIDRTKDIETSTQIMEGKRNSYSMGAWVDRYTCSYCGEEVGKCEHIPAKAPVCFYEKDGKIVHKNMHGMSGFECSTVATPAWSPATSDVIYS